MGPWHRRRAAHLAAVLALALALATGPGARTAAACDFPDGYLGTGAQLPLGCPVHLYNMVGLLYVPPQVTVLRDGAYVDVTGPISLEMVELPVERTTTSCPPGVPDFTTHSLELFEHDAIIPQGAREGERVGLGAGWFSGIEIVAAAPCPAPVLPTPSCVDSPPCFGKEPPPLPPIDVGDTSSGCAAGAGAPGALALLAAVALVRRSPRRRPGR